MAYSKRSKVEERIYKEWLEQCQHIAEATAVTINETEDQAEARKKQLQNNYEKFCAYYFGHYIDSPMAWFHKKAAKEIKNDPNIMCINEWPREHAKSVHMNVFMPLFLYARGELTGMIVGSANQEKAMTLLSDLQAEFVSNEKWIKDYGELARYGDWSEGKFSTTDGMGFWAFGRGQSPRGVRKAALRPNYASIDDIDDKVIVRNLGRVKDAVLWVLEDVLGALNIKGSRLIISGNRIHKQSILAHLVGDIEPKDPKREGITHIKVFAIEDPKTHKKSSPQAGGKPAWSRYTITDFEARRKKQGERPYRREYFHEHHVEGTIFKQAWIHWVKPLPIEKYDCLITYTDPSWKSSSHNDYKAVITIGKTKKYIDILRAWVRQATVASMVKVNYDLYDELENYSLYYMEANALQDLLFDDFEEEGETRGYMMPIRGDKRKKPNKEVRIEGMSGLFERGYVRFSEKERSSPDMKKLITQLLGFPYDNDDGPDALEGAIFLAQKRGRTSGQTTDPRSGAFNRKSSRD